MQFNRTKFIKCIVRNDWLKLLKFAFVGASGAIINLSFLWFLANYAHLFYMFAALLAIEISILWNFILNSKLTFHYKFKSQSFIFYSLIKYHLASLFGIIINLLALFILTEFLMVYYIISETIAILLAFGLNYVLSTRIVWKTP